MNFKFMLLSLYLLSNPVSISNSNVLINKYFKEFRINSVKSYKASCVYKNQKIEIITEYMTIVDSDKEVKNLILKQILTFYLNNKKVKEITFPFNTSEFSIGKNRKIKKVDTIIIGVKYIEKEGEIICSLYGLNTVESSHEFFGITTRKGDWIWYYYGDGYTTYKKYGSKEDTIKKYGNEVNSLKGMEKIFPLPR